VISCLYSSRLREAERYCFDYVITRVAVSRLFCLYTKDEIFILLKLINMYECMHGTTAKLRVSTPHNSIYTYTQHFPKKSIYIEYLFPVHAAMRHIHEALTHQVRARSTSRTYPLRPGRNNRSRLCVRFVQCKICGGENQKPAIAASWSTPARKGPHRLTRKSKVIGKRWLKGWAQVE
jgi:hypothetical protein